MSPMRKSSEINFVLSGENDGLEPENVEEVKAERRRKGISNRTRMFAARTCERVNGNSQKIRGSSKMQSQGSIRL